MALITSFYFDPLNDHTLFVFLQDGGGGLLAPIKYQVVSSQGYGTRTVDVGDLNGDGRDDVVVGRNSGFVVLVQNASGALDPGVSYQTTGPIHKVRVGDFDSDGLKDVASLVWAPAADEVVIHAQTRGGILVESATYASTNFDTLEVTDLNGDGRDDLVISEHKASTARAVLLLQRSEGLFGAGIEYTAGSARFLEDLGVGDIDGNGRDDLVFSMGGNQPESNIQYWIQNPSGSLVGPGQRMSFDGPGASVVADVDSDLRADIVVLHLRWERLGVYRQRVDGALADEQLFPIPYNASANSQALAVGDVNGDGAHDVVFADYDFGLVVLLQKPSAPTSLSTAQTSDSQVRVTWTTFAGATAYEVYRRASGGTFKLVGTSTTPAFLDPSVSPGEAYVYRVRAVVPGGFSEYSPLDLATVVSFTDVPLVGGSSTLKAVHLQELRTAVGAVRSLAGLPAATFTDDIAAGVTARAVHITELRTALDEAYAALSMPRFAYAGPMGAGVPIKASHVQELRARLQ